MDGTHELYNLVHDITSGKCNSAKAKQRLSAIADRYPELYFTSYQPKRKTHPWSREDLKELEELFINGACSKEMICYMAEVSDEVYKPERTKKLIAAICASFAILAALVFVIGKLVKR